MGDRGKKGHADTPPLPWPRSEFQGQSQDSEEGDEDRGEEGGGGGGAGGGGPLRIEVHVHEAHRVVPVLIDEEMPAQQVCEVMAHKMNIREEDFAHYVLIMIYTVRYEEPGEAPPPSAAGGGGPRPPPSSGGGSGEIEYRHLLRTLAPGDRPHREAARARRHPHLVWHRRAREGGGPGGRGGGEVRAPALRWVYKDARAAPLELGGEVSGSSTSADEAGHPWRDLAHLGKGDHAGYLLKQSSSDPNLWRRRWCVLVADKLWVLKHQLARRQPRAPHLSLVRGAAKILGEEGPDPGGRARGGGGWGRGGGGGGAQTPSPKAGQRAGYHGWPFEVQTVGQTYQFRATSQKDRQDWVRRLNEQVALAGENDYIALAEHIICDQEAARSRRHRRALLDGYDRNRLGRALAAHGVAAPPPAAAAGAAGAGAAAAAAGGAAPARPPAHLAAEDPWPHLARCRAAAQCLGFLDAVHAFEEMARHPFGFPARAEEKWAKVQRVLDEFCLAPSADKDVVFYGGLPFSAAAAAPVRAALGPYKAYLAERARCGGGGGKGGEGGGGGGGKGGGGGARSVAEKAHLLQLRRDLPPPPPDLLRPLRAEALDRLTKLECKIIL